MARTDQDALTTILVKLLMGVAISDPLECNSILAGAPFVGCMKGDLTCHESILADREMATPLALMWDCPRQASTGQEGRPYTNPSGLVSRRVNGDVGQAVSFIFG